MQKCACLCHSQLFARVWPWVALPASTLFVMTVVVLLGMLKALVAKPAVTTIRARLCRRQGLRRLVARV